MTLDADRGVGLPTVCPFVAFADDRDLRAAEPDHRHRCYAEPRPSPRALAHQARFCLSPGFTTCPTFQDWATREAARVADVTQAIRRAERDPGGLFDNATAAASVGIPPVPPAHATEDAATGRRGLAGEGAAALAGGEPEDAAPEDAELAEGEGVAATGRVPDWDRPRPRRDYPRLASSPRVPRVLVGVVGLGAAAVVLFLLAGFVAGMLGGRQAAASPTPSGSVAASGGTVGSATPAGPTVEPSATPLTYKVAAGDTLTKIAKKFNVTVAQILAANPTIKNADSIQKDQLIVIPTPGASASPLSSP